MIKIEYSEDAKCDLQLTYENLNAFDQSGASFFNKILINNRKLSEIPKIGASLQTKTEIITDYRYLVFPFTKKQVYIVIYRIDEKANLVYINRIFDGKMNYLNVLFND